MLFWWCAETTVVAGALAVVAALAGRARRLGPSARHALWLVVLLKLMTPPLVRSPWPVFRAEPAAPAPVATVGVPELTAAADPAGGAERARRDAFREALAARLLTALVTPSDERVVTAEVAAPVPPAAPKVEAGEPFPLGRWAFGAWLAVSVVLAAGQGARVLAFRRRLRFAKPAPAWLVDETRALADRFGVRAPEAFVVDGLGVPLLWCLGRPKLLLPRALVKTLGADRWRGVLAHELAHVRRGDPWVGRLELLAGLVWWWNPLYWLARHRLDAEAELACDAWVVWALPGDRLVYAETVLNICESLSRPARFPAPAPALGVTGAGRFFERRLTMIVRESVPNRLSLPGLIGAGLLVALGLPSWTMAEPPAAPPAPPAAPASPAPPAPPADVEEADEPDDVQAAEEAKEVAEEAKEAIVEAKEAAREAVEAAREAEAEGREAAEEARQEAEAAEREAREDAKADNDDDDDNAKPRAKDGGKPRSGDKAKDGDKVKSGDKPKVKARAEVRRRERVKVRSSDRRTKDGPRGGDVKPDDEGETEVELNLPLAELGKAFGPDFQKSMAKVLEDIEEAFGPDMAKTFETLGPELEKLLKEKLGPGSEFEAKMKKLGAKLEKDLEKLGPGSDFEKAIKKFAETLGQGYGPEAGKGPRGDVKTDVRVEVKEGKPDKKDDAKDKDKDEDEDEVRVIPRERRMRERIVIRERHDDAPSADKPGHDGLSADMTQKHQAEMHAKLAEAHANAMKKAAEARAKGDHMRQEATARAQKLQAEMHARIAEAHADAMKKAEGARKEAAEKAGRIEQLEKEIKELRDEVKRLKAAKD